MKYDVFYKPDAEAELADAWTTATDRPAVTQAADRIEARLRRNPVTAGESRPGGRRIVIDSPLIVTFEVIEDDKKVNIVRVRLREPGRPA